MCNRTYLFYLLIFAVTFSVSYCDVEDDSLKWDNDLEPEISCGKNGYVLIATIDGNLTSIDFSSGRKCWTVVLDKEAFFSSSLDKLEVWENGTQVWLIPSLDGVLFRYDKVKLEPLPFSAELFLSQSAALDQSTCVTGGKFKVVYGIHQHSGKVFYKCTLNGCETFSKVSTQDALIIELLIQTVNAVDSASAEQKWYFRVVEIQIKAINSELPQNSSQYKHNTQDNSAIIPINLWDDLSNISTVKISLLNGYTARVNHSSSDFTWLYKTSAPIIDVWYVKDEVHLLDPFADETEFISIDSGDGKHTALLFLGSYMNQLFVKQSKKLKNKVLFNHALTRPIIYQAYCLPLHFKNEIPVLPSNESNDLVLANLNINDHGFYFYINFSVYDNDTHCIVNFNYPKAYEKFEDYLWIKVSTIVLIILLSVAWTLLQHFFAKKEFANEGTSTTETTENNQKFVSRFHKDFQLITILGKGGFGIVMEVKNKIDDCDYAVKRIRISADKNCEKLDQEYVLREVKALAKLNHPGIVRYFNSWVENPPKGWQERKDSSLNIKDVSSNSEENQSPNSSKLKPVPKRWSGISKKLRINPFNPFPEVLLDSNNDHQPSTSGLQRVPVPPSSSSDTFSSSSSEGTLNLDNDQQPIQPVYDQQSSNNEGLLDSNNDQQPSTSGTLLVNVQQQSSSNDAHISSSSSNEGLLDSNSDQQRSTSDIEHVYMQESASSDEDHTSSSSSNEEENQQPNNLDPIDGNNEYPVYVQESASNDEDHTSSSSSNEDHIFCSSGNEWLLDSNNDQQPSTSVIQPIYIQQSSSDNGDHISSSSSNEEENQQPNNLDPIDGNNEHPVYVQESASNDKDHTSSSSSNEDHIFCSSGNEGLLESNNDQQPSTSGIQPIYIQQSSSNNEDISSSSSSEEENQQPNNLDPIDGNNDGNDEAIGQMPQRHIEVLQQLRDLANDVINDDDDDSGNFYMPMFHRPGSYTSSEDSDSGETDSDSDSDEVLNDDIHRHRRRDFRRHYFSEDDVFSHIREVNESLGRLMNSYFLDKLRNFLLADIRKQNWSNWVSILDDIPPCHITENLNLFRRWLRSVGRTVRPSQGFYYSVLYVNLKNIYREVKRKLEVGYEPPLREREIPGVLEIRWINRKLAWPMKSVYFKKLHHYMFYDATYLEPHQYGETGWEILFYRSDEKIYKKNLSLFRIWIISILCHLCVTLDGHLGIVISNLCYILSRVNDILAEDSFQLASSDIFFNFYGNLLNEPQGDTQFNEEDMDFCMFENQRSYKNGKTKTKIVVPEEGNEHSFLYIQMQLCRRDNLRCWLDHHCYVRNYSEVMSIFVQIVDAIDYVHTRGLMHRDLKPSNIYFSLEGLVKIGDFGLATHFGVQSCDNDSSILLHAHTRQCGTELYMSPEQRSMKVYDFKTDIFPLGIILYELFVPFQTESERCQAIVAARKCEFSGKFILEHPDECMLARKLLDKDPKERPTASEIKNHPLCQPYLQPKNQILHLFS